MKTPLTHPTTTLTLLPRKQLAVPPTTTPRHHNRMVMTPRGIRIEFLLVRKPQTPFASGQGLVGFGFPLLVAQFGGGEGAFGVFAYSAFEEAGGVHGDCD